MPRVIITQGHHISRLAKAYGLGSYEKIWNHAENANLKKLRGNPNVLLPGDEVFVPDFEEKALDGATDKTHTYTVSGKPLRLRLIVQDSTGKPQPNVGASLDIEGKSLEVTTDGSGLIDEKIPPLAEHGSLKFADPEQAPFAEPVEVCIGHLDPIDTETGQIGRLNNLGYYAGSPEPRPDGASQEEQDERDRILRSAIEEFQCDNKLTVDGICGPKTQKKLQDVYGC